MSDELLTVGVGAGSAVTGSLVTWLVQQWVGRSLRKDDKHETERDAKLDQLLIVVQKLELEMSRIIERLASQGTTYGALKERVEGISGDYGPKLQKLDTGLTELRVIVEQVLIPKRRRSSK